MPQKSIIDLVGEKSPVLRVTVNNDSFKTFFGARISLNYIMRYFGVIEQFSDQFSYLQSCDNFRVTFSCHLSELIHLQDVTKCQFISNM